MSTLFKRLSDTKRKKEIKFKILSLLILIGGLMIIVNLFSSSRSLLKRKDIFLEKEKELKELEKKNLELKGKLKKVQSEEFVEKEAREKLGMGKKGEVVVILPEFELRGSSLNQNQFGSGQGSEVEEEIANWRKWYNLFFLRDSETSSE